MALKEDKEVVDLQVENALYKRAIDYTFEEKTWERGVTEDGKPGLILAKVVLNEIAGDVTAQIYWLKNRKRDIWKNNHDRAEVERMRLDLDQEKFKDEKEQRAAEDGPQLRVVLFHP